MTSFIAPWGELISVDDSPDDEIERYMTAEPVTVAPQTPLGEVAQRMVDAHIHRLLVVDEQRPVGIVTSTDIMAAVVRKAQNSLEENESPRPGLDRRRQPRMAASSQRKRAR
jgi:CBS-domain-containing membrane protein